MENEAYGNGAANVPMENGHLAQLHPIVLIGSGYIVPIVDLGNGMAAKLPPNFQLHGILADINDLIPAIIFQNSGQLLEVLSNASNGPFSTILPDLLNEAEPLGGGGEVVVAPLQAEEGTDDEDQHGHGHQVNNTSLIVMLTTISLVMVAMYTAYQG